MNLVNPNCPNDLVTDVEVENLNELENLIDEHFDASTEYSSTKEFFEESGYNLEN